MIEYGRYRSDTWGWVMRRGLAVLVGTALVGALAAVPSSAGTAPLCGASVASSWVPTLPTSQQSRQILSAFPGGTGFVFDLGSAITLWHSGNFGETWDPLTYLPAGTSSFAEVRFATPAVGYMTDFFTMYRTRDGASTPDWTPLPGPRLPKGDSYGATTLGVTGATVAVGGEVYAPFHLGCNTPVSQDIWTSHDEGRSWLTARLPDDAAVARVQYVNARDGVALAYEMRPDGNPCEYLGQTNSVYVTHDGGHHFTRVLRCAAAPGELCTSVIMLDAKHVLAGRNDGTMAVSHDGGRTFAPGPTLPTILGAQPTKSGNDDTFWIQGFAQAGGTLFATTKFAGAYLSHDGGRTWTAERSCDSTYTLGIGEVAAFDGQRAIAGGPACVATRIGVGASAGAFPGRSGMQREVPAVEAGQEGADWVASYGGMTRMLSRGRLTIRRRVQPT